MPRLLLFLAIAVIGGLLLRSFSNSTSRHRDTYRPRRRAQAGKGGDGATFLSPRADLAGLRDAFSAEPIDPDRALLRCPSCQAMYHADSVVTLRRENAGRCASCAGTRFDPVQVTD
ncbi:MAG: hypothetical protein R3E68_08300 [Burkholderiaceae bacterium]